MKDNLNRTGINERTPETDLAHVVFEIQRIQTNSCKFGRRHERLFSKRELDQLGIEESTYKEVVAP